MLPSYSTRRTTGLRTMAALGILLRIDVVVRWVGDLAKVHAAATPVGPETTGLDACELNAPFGLHFLGDRLCKSFDCPFAGTIYGEAGNTCCTSAIEIIHKR
jgi:hypothetical protein